MMLRKDFCIFILTHGRPDNILTLKALEKAGYTGELFLVCDDDDKELERYKANYGDRVKVFHKEEKFDIMDGIVSTEYRRYPVYARNECFKIAKELGYRYFLQLDDDYQCFKLRYEQGGELKSRNMKQMDAICEAMLKLLDAGITCVAFAVQGDMIGGLKQYRKGLIWQAKNCFFCDTEKAFTFLGRINEDVTTPLRYNAVGKMFLTTMGVMIQMLPSEKNDGGSTEQYKASSLYWNFSYPLLMCPGAYKVGVTAKGMNRRISHDNAHPKILSDTWKK